MNIPNLSDQEFDITRIKWLCCAGCSRVSKTSSAFGPWQVPLGPTPAFADFVMIACCISLFLSCKEGSDLTLLFHCRGSALLTHETGGHGDRMGMTVLQYEQRTELK